jgi:glycosyltransferase involved in cell wall biosynthesis
VSIFFDARFITVGHTDGISRFSVNLYRELHKLMPITVIVASKEQLSELPADSPHIFESPADSIRELGFAKRMNARGAKVIFSPMQTTGGLGRKFKLVLTIHDLIYYTHRTPPRRFNAAVRLAWRLYHLSFVPQRLLLRKADALVTVSDTSKRAIENARLFAGPVHMIPNAVDDLLAARSDGGKRNSASASSSGTGDPTNGQPIKVVYTGSFMPYKDVETLIRGCSKAFNDVELNLVSPIDSARKAQLERLAVESQTSVIFHNGLTDLDYAQLLDESSLFATASLAEGFCIPVLEAFARGVPVVCSDLEVLREVAAEGAVFFEPGNPQSLGRAIAQAHKTRAELSERALERTKDFSWAESARQLKRVIEGLL